MGRVFNTQDKVGSKSRGEIKGHMLEDDVKGFRFARYQLPCYTILYLTPYNSFLATHSPKGHYPIGYRHMPNGVSHFFFSLDAYPKVCPGLTSYF